MNGVRLKHVCHMRAGGTPPVDDAAMWDDETGTPWVAIGDMTRSPIVITTERRVSSTGMAYKSLPLGAKGTILFAMYASVGALGRLGTSATWNQAILGLTPVGGLAEPRFLSYWLSHLKPTLASLFRSNTQNNLNAEQVGNLPFTEFSIDEQRRIADFLDAETARIDLLTACHSRQATALVERHNEVARTLTTHGLDSGAATRNTQIAWMPLMNATWSLRKVAHVFRTGSGTTPPSMERQYYDGRVPWLNTGDLRDGPVKDTAKSVTDLALAAYPTLRVYQPGALVIAMYGATIGRLGILTQPACVNQACCVLDEPSHVRIAYAFHWLLSHRKEIVALAAGGGQPNISQETVRSLRIPAPSEQDQQDIVRVIDRDADQTTALNRCVERQNELLREKRGALITAAVTGQLDATTARGAI